MANILYLNRYNINNDPSHFKLQTYTVFFLQLILSNSILIYQNVLISNLLMSDLNLMGYSN